MRLTDVGPNKFTKLTTSLLPLASFLVSLSHCNNDLESEIIIPDSAPPSIDFLLGKSWSFVFDPSPRTFQSPRIPEALFRGKLEKTREARGSCGGGPDIAIAPEGLFSDGRIFELVTLRGYRVSRDGINLGPAVELDYIEQFSGFDSSGNIVFSTEGTLHLFRLGRKEPEEDEGIWVMSLQPRSVFWTLLQKISDAFPWSLSAALTPGDHHVRLYLETGGKIRTMLSKIDNFTEFQNGDVGPVTFQTPTAQRLSPFPVRDPNVSRNDAGVYVMTWDNRPPDIGPGHPDDSTGVSETFGLAFSLDGLNWTVYSNEMTLQGPFPELSSSPDCGSNHTGRGRHVVPIFVSDEALRLYFSAQIGRGGTNCPGTELPLYTCGTGTAISN